MKKISVLILVLLCVGCTSFQDQNMELKDNKATNKSLKALQESPDLVNYPFGKPESSEVKNYRWGHLKGEKKEEARRAAGKRLRKSVGALSTIIPIIENNFEIHSNEPDDRIISKIQIRLDEYHDSEVFFLIEQMTASLLMSAIYPNYTLKSNLDRYRHESMETKHINLLNFATSLFVKNANPNAYLIAFNLEKLSGHIPDNVLKNYASKTMESAKSWFQINNDCVGCSTVDNSNALSRKVELVQKGLANLKGYTN